MEYFLSERQGAYFGIACEEHELHIAFSEMADVVGLGRENFKRVSEQVYSDTVMDLRFEDGEVSQ